MGTGGVGDCICFSRYDESIYQLDLSSVSQQARLRISATPAPNMATTREYTLEKIAGHQTEEILGQGALVEAKHASDEEHAESLWQAIKANKKAVAWSVLVSMSVVMEGYDTILIGNFFGYPEFQKKYGHDYGGTAGYQVSAPWQTGLGMGSTVGAIFGISPSSFHGRNEQLIVFSFGTQEEL